VNYWSASSAKRDNFRYSRLIQSICPLEESYFEQSVISFQRSQTEFVLSIYKLFSHLAITRLYFKTDIYKQTRNNLMWRLLGCAQLRNWLKLQFMVSIEWFCDLYLVFVWIYHNIDLKQLQTHDCFHNKNIYILVLHWIVRFFKDHSLESALKMLNNRYYCYWIINENALNSCEVLINCIPEPQSTETREAKNKMNSK